jgi:hypothetical protein
MKHIITEVKIMKRNDILLNNYIQQQSEAIKRLHNLNKNTDTLISKINKILGEDE